MEKIISFKIIEGQESQEVVETNDKNKEIIEHLEEQIKILKTGEPAQKAVLIICFDDRENEEHFQYSAFDISPRDFIYLSEKIKLRYLST